MNRFMNRVFLAASIAASLSATANAAIFTWDGEIDNGIFTAGNYSPDGAPGNNSGDTLVFPDSSGLIGVQSTSPTSSLVSYFGDVIYNSGAPTYTLSGGGLSLELYDVASAEIVKNNSSNHQIISNTGAPILISGILNAAAGDLVVNGPVAVGSGSSTGALYLQLDGSHNIYFNVDTTIHPDGNIAGGTWTSSQSGQMHSSVRGRMYMSTFSGTAYMGDIGSSYQGAINVDSVNNGALRLTHNNSLGLNKTTGSGSTARNAAVIIHGGTTANGTLELSGNISVVRPIMYAEGRSGAVANDPHILNVSGNNTYTVSVDWNTVLPPSAGGGNSAGNINIFSDSGKLTMAGGQIYNTSAPVRTFVLGGLADGEVTAQVTKYQANPSLSVSKTGVGTWTLSNLLNNYDAATTITGGTLLVNGAHTSTDVAATYFVDVNGTLGGIGTISSPSVVSDGVLSPGASVGELTFNNVAGSVTSNGNLLIQYDTTLGSPIDVLDVDGTLNFGPSSSISFSNIGGALDGVSSYVFANYGTLTGSLPTYSAPIGYLVDFNYGGTNDSIALVPVPEPSTLALGALGMIGCVGYGLRRRRSK